MIEFITEQFKCAVCGCVHPYKLIFVVQPEGQPDLDFRPASPLREAMQEEVQECPFCGYTARYIHDPTSAGVSWILSEAYVKCAGHDIKSNLARKFYRLYMTLLHDGKDSDALEALMQCAWASDDAQDKETARMCRLKAADLILSLPHDAETEFRMINYMDLLRRAGEFERLLEESKDTWFENPFYKRFYRYERSLAKKHDDSCHSLSELL